MDPRLLLWLSLVCLTDCAKIVPVSAGGWQANRKEEYPWVVGIHKMTKFGNFSHICGGSLVKLQVVISAAHCFWSSGKTLPVDQFLISAGNLYRDIQHNEDKQERKVQEILVHERYRHQELNFAHDIALVTLTERVTQTARVSPIALDLSSSFRDDSLKDQAGTVVGWGFTEHDEPSVRRVAVSLPFVDFDPCWNTVPRTFRKSVTADKFCAGRRNGTSVCPGDSGGGLAFRGPNKVWYLRGVVSVGVQPEGISNCYTTQLSAFTSIASYRDWLQDKPQYLYGSSVKPQIPSGVDVYYL